MTEQRNRHHLIHTARAWNIYKEGAAIRNTPELIVDIPAETHNALHRSIPAVPLLGYYALTHTLSRFEPVRGDTFATIDNLLSSMDSAARTPKTHYIDRSQIAVTQWAIELQRDFLKEAIR